MSTIDPRLRHLINSTADVLAGTSENLGLGPEAMAPIPTAEVLVRLRIENESTDQAVAAIQHMGMNVRYLVHGTDAVVSGTVPLDRLSAIEQMGSVRRIESSRPLTPEMDLCLAEVRANLLHSGDPAIKGDGVIVGIIDSGIDFRHPDFQRDDGTTRILHFWDQNALPGPDGEVPYGREYNAAQINAALIGDAEPSDIPQIDRIGHGTHVCGIAAGGGRAKATHLGLAPEAKLIIVSVSSSGASTLGHSVRAFEAFAYVVEKADGAPVAINFSQGVNGGGHCGETVLETGLENLARRPGVVIVKSAGNEQQMRIHAGGAIQSNETKQLSLEVRANNRLNDLIEIWFDDRDDIAVAVAPPGGDPTPFVSRGGEEVFPTGAGNEVTIDLDADAEGTGDTVATIILSRGASNMIQPGGWQLLLRAGAVVNKRFDAWIERTDRVMNTGEQTRFSEDSTDPTRTITIPGTAHSVITVGSYVTRLFEPPDAPLGAVSLFSSRGPTRYGNLKPDLSAPGEVTEAARAGTAGITRMRGTSMAAPVVTGAAALILSQRPELSGLQLKQILTRSASRSGVAAGAPDRDWGHGKLNVQAALELARNVRFPVVSNVEVAGDTISWETDIETTGAIRFLPSRRQLLLGKNARSISDLTLARSHRIRLTAVPVGEYFCQIVAFSSDNFSSEEDNGGRCFRIQSISTDVTPEDLNTPTNVPATVAVGGVT
jgi:subtilisin family serine protease